jgi:hypothetical protein
MAYLSHVVGVVVSIPTLTAGPDSGMPPSSPNTWTIQAPSSPVPDTKYLILHFANAHLPANNRVEVDLGYDTDIFRAVDGSDFWTRPINVKVLAGAPVVVRYITDGAAIGGVQVDKFGQGERHAGTQDPTSSSNCDPFFTTPSYIEPKYDPFWYCADPPNWENAACVTDPGDVRARVSRSVGMIISVEGDLISTCSVTLIDTDQIISAGHCHSRAEALTSSVTFDYQTDCAGNRVPGYNPRFVKVAQVLDLHNDGVGDFSRLRLASAPPGIPPIQMRADIPGAGEQIFGIHHPNGAVKKLSIPHSGGFDTVFASSPSAVQVPKNFHVSGGSSGSGLFDTAGRIIGVLSSGNPCQGVFLNYFPTSSILRAIAPSPPTPITRDVMIVFDHSGSMSELDTTGRMKIEVAQDAVSLFVQLIRSDVGNRVGLVSFSTKAASPVDFLITDVGMSTKLSLIGPPPFAGGKVGGLVPSGSTSIGEGLDAARLQFPVPVVNPRAILLMTDGMQNTPRFIKDVEGMLGGIDIHAIGLGTDANLDGTLLSKLASDHNGGYSRAGSGVALQKFFSHAFGNIFETGLITDPEYDLPANQNASQPISFQVCGEDGITVAVGWDSTNTSARIKLTTPSGATITGPSPDIEEAVGRTWTFLRVPLPHSGERDGTWNVTVFRPINSSFVPLHYFINVIPTGGPRLLRAPDDKAYYTGDTLNPIVLLRYFDGDWPDDATAHLTLSRPNASIGSILSQGSLQPPITVGGDTIPSRQATLAAIEQDYGPLTTIVDEIFKLSDDSSSTGGTFEAAAVFGIPLSDKLVTEGDYMFHARATYGQGSCTSTREVLWSLHVDVGIDSSHTNFTIIFTDDESGGPRAGNVTVVPGDRYGNRLGPGRSDGVSIVGSAGTIVTGGIADNGDGSYTVPVVWDPGFHNPPGLVIGQPGRPPIVVQRPSNVTRDCMPHHGWPDKGNHHHGWPGKGKSSGSKPHKRDLNLNLNSVSDAAQLRLVVDESNRVLLVILTTCFQWQLE